MLNAYSNLVTHIKEQNHTLPSSPLCNIQTLSIADVVQNKDEVREYAGMQFFKYSKDKSIPDYIAFLKEQEAQNE